MLRFRQLVTEAVTADTQIHWLTHRLTPKQPVFLHTLKSEFLKSLKSGKEDTPAAFRAWAVRKGEVRSSVRSETAISLADAGKFPAYKNAPSQNFKNNPMNAR